jgi:hypothetical protein
MDPLTIVLATMAIFYVAIVITRMVEIFVDYRNRVQIIPATI